MSLLTSPIKSLLASVLPEEHMRSLEWHHHWLGAWPMAKSYARRLATHRNLLVRARVPEVATAICLRPWTADRIVFWQVFHDREYDFDLGRPAVIVDAGANIGLASLLFANRYPGARILAIEPEAANFLLLQHNTALYDNIMPLQAGLWSHKASLAIENPDGDPWGFRVTESDEPSALPALGVLDAMEAMNADRIDVLKIDIEGAEREVLARSSEWIDRVGMVIVETHDWIPGSTEALARMVEAHALQQRQVGENNILTHV